MIQPPASYILHFNKLSQTHPSIFTLRDLAKPSEEVFIVRLQACLLGESLSAEFDGDEEDRRAFEYSSFVQALQNEGAEGIAASRMGLGWGLHANVRCYAAEIQVLLSDFEVNKLSELRRI